MWLKGTVWNKIDSNLTAGNLKSWVTAYGVTGTFSNGFWSNAVGKTQFWVWAASVTMPQYAFEIHYTYTQTASRNCFVDYWSYIVVGIWRDSYSPTNFYTSFFRITKSTGLCIQIGDAGCSYGAYGSTYFESWHIYWNMTDWTMFNIDINAWTITSGSGNHTTWTVPSTTSLVYNWLTFTVPAFISTDNWSGTLRRWNSLTSAFNRMWILIS